MENEKRIIQHLEIQRLTREHNFGHGQQALSNLLLALNLIDFKFHTCCEQLCALWRQTRDRFVTRKRLFTTLEMLNDYFYYTDWKHQLTSILHPRPPP